MGKAAEISPSSGPGSNDAAIQRLAGLWIACSAKSDDGRGGRQMLIQSLPQSSRNASRRIQGQPSQCRPVILLSIQPLCREPHSLGSDGPLVRCVDHRHLLVRQLPRPREIPDVVDIRRCHLVPPVLRFGPFLVRHGSPMPRRPSGFPAALTGQTKVHVPKLERVRGFGVVFGDDGRLIP
jgi:hypothetical protein